MLYGKMVHAGEYEKIIKIKWKVHKSNATGLAEIFNSS